MSTTSQGSSAPSPPGLGFLLVICFSLYSVQGVPAATSRSVEIEEHDLGLSLAVGSEREKLAVLVERYLITYLTSGRDLLRGVLSRRQTRSDRTAQVARGQAWLAA